MWERFQIVVRSSWSPVEVGRGKRRSSTCCLTVVVDDPHTPISILFSCWVSSESKQGKSVPLQLQICSPQPCLSEYPLPHTFELFLLRVGLTTKSDVFIVNKSVIFFHISWNNIHIALRHTAKMLIKVHLKIQNNLYNKCPWLTIPAADIFFSLWWHN